MLLLGTIYSIVYAQLTQPACVPYDGKCIGIKLLGAIKAAAGRQDVIGVVCDEGTLVCGGSDITQHTANRLLYI